VWETKLKILRKEVKTWARENEKKNKKRRPELTKKMDSLQEAKEIKEDKQDYLQENELFGEMYRENRKEEEEMRLKSRSLWLNAGDKNTTCFHNSMQIRRARNQIDKIQVDGQEIKRVEELKKETHNHFKNLLTANEEIADHDNFLQHTPKKIRDGQNAEIM